MVWNLRKTRIRLLRSPATCSMGRGPTGPCMRPAVAEILVEMDIMGEPTYDSAYPTCEDHLAGRIRERAYALGRSRAHPHPKRTRSDLTDCPPRRLLPPFLTERPDDE